MAKTAQAVSLNSIVVAATNQVASELAGETVVLNLKSGVYYGLDPVGTSIWRLLQEPRPVRDILATLLNEYDVQPEKCRRDLLALLQRLTAEGLVDVTGMAGISGVAGATHLSGEDGS